MIVNLFFIEKCPATSLGTLTVLYASSIKLRLSTSKQSWSIRVLLKAHKSNCLQIAIRELKCKFNFVRRDRRSLSPVADQKFTNFVYNASFTGSSKDFGGGCDHGRMSFQERKKFWKKNGLNKNNESALDPQVSAFCERYITFSSFSAY